MTPGFAIYNGLKIVAQGIFVGLPVFLTVTDNICTVCQVEGVSMQPVLNPTSCRTDFVLINRWKAKKFENIERGDVVSIISPKDPTTLFIKRIIALEGDEIRTLSYKTRIVNIPKGHCWVEGDNCDHSFDSNSFGPVPLGLVHGLATRIVWPPSRWAKLTQKIPPGRTPFDFSHTKYSHGVTNVRDDIACDAPSDVMNDVTYDFAGIENSLRSDEDVNFKNSVGEIKVDNKGSNSVKTDSDSVNTE